MHRLLEPRTAAVVAVVIIMVVCACAGAPPTATQLASSPPTQPLECEAQAFPCTFGEVPEDVRLETERLIADATRRTADGATNDELVAWLQTQPKVAEVEGDPDAVRFRPVGGRGVWIVRRVEGAPEPAALASSVIAHMGTWDQGMSPPNRSESVTGAGLPERRALVLSPYRWDFGETDDGRPVADRLRRMPEYASGVTYAENAAVTSTDVTVDDFRGWQGLQVVHIVSHGSRLCKNGTCRAVVTANALPGGTANFWPSAVRGAELEVEVNPAEAPAKPKYHVLLGADFFRDQYPGGLDDTVVFLNGCSTFGPGATDLADTIRGQSSVVLGWSRPVISEIAHDAAIALYGELAGNGRTVDDALEAMGELAVQRVTPTGPADSTLTSTGRVVRGDLRIRDVVDFQDSDGGPLPEGAEVQLIGQPGDGVPDAVSWQLRVDGIAAQAAASAMVQVTIDGHAAGPVAISSGTPAAVDSWLLSGTLDLRIDVGSPHPADFEASLELPEGGQSVDRVAAILVGQSEATPAAPSMGTVWRGEATYTLEVSAGVKHTAHADLVFTLERVTDGAIFAYELTGGTMTYAVSGTETAPDGCKHELAPAEFAINPDDSDAEFVIDTRNSPPTFYGHANVHGPIVEVMQTCYGEYAYLTGPYSTRADGFFMSVAPDEKRTVENDRISGMAADRFSSSTFELSRSE